MTRDLRKILVANRGEIALRIMRTIREMGRASVAVYSDVDIAMPFVSYADEAYALGGNDARQTYLDIDKIVSIAKKAKVDAIHPGYGFLSENEEFALAVERAGIVFIGPGHAAIRSMGDKTEARKLVAQSGVPIVPGTSDPVADVQAAVKVASQIGYPLIIKAAAGGGGKGMRLVSERGQLDSSLRGAQSEALSAFGDGRVFIEKYVSNPRHIEFQILADGSGNVIHLFERECSIQRRHQKVIEETPSVLLDDKLREEMGSAAVNAAKACGYVNAGTVEFIMGGDGKFYFLEMNTRLQVEHAVTEMTVGLDLVREQINIAEGRAVDLRQVDVKRKGHAIECRIYAEDVYNDFLPVTGKLKLVRPPFGNWVRVDSGVETGSEISVFYDPMIAKLVVLDTTRDLAIRKMIRALSEFVILGVETTIPFCKFVMESDAFIRGDYSTHFVEESWNGRGAQMAGGKRNGLEVAAILAASELSRNPDETGRQGGTVTKRSTWLDGRFDS
ncbi:MAG TPA: acetyl-CoA carboxylase biotin carboxylase subunit [Candidatus Kryptonia bacterium]